MVIVALRSGHASFLCLHSLKRRFIYPFLFFMKKGIPSNLHLHQARYYPLRPPQLRPLLHPYPYPQFYCLLHLRSKPTHHPSPLPLLQFGRYRLFFLCLLREILMEELFFFVKKKEPINHLKIHKGQKKTMKRKREKRGRTEQPTSCSKKDSR